MTTLKDISTTAWQLSLGGVGIVVEGLDDIRQCIDIILRTVKGTDPFRPQFGSDVYEYVDKPPAIAIPNIKKAIIEAISIWEKRVSINKIEHYTNINGADSQIIYNIIYGITDSDIVDEFKLTVGGGVFNTSGSAAAKLIVEAAITSGPRFYLSMLLDGAEALPLPPVTGFSSMVALYGWLNDYWGFYGTWYYMFYQGKVIGYINAGMASSGSLSISSPQHTIVVAIPELPDGEYYYIGLMVNGNYATPGFPQDTFTTQDEIITWLQENWGVYGEWSIADNQLILISAVQVTDTSLEIVTASPSAFSTGFSTGFNA